MNWRLLQRKTCCPWTRTREAPLGWTGFSRSWPSSILPCPRRTQSPQPRLIGWTSAPSWTTSCSGFTCWFWSCMLGLCCCSGWAGALPDTSSEWNKIKYSIKWLWQTEWIEIYIWNMCVCINVLWNMYMLYYIYAIVVTRDVTEYFLCRFYASFLLFLSLCKHLYNPIFFKCSNLMLKVPTFILKHHFTVKGCISSGVCWTCDDITPPTGQFSWRPICSRRVKMLLLLTWHWCC